MIVDLLVVSYNTKDKLIRLLDTIHSDYESDVWQIFIQDNGSTDGTVEWLLGEAPYDYQLAGMHLSDNVGYAKAINEMAARSDSEILAAVNADTWFTTNHVKQMIKSFEDNPNQAICGPKQMDENNLIRHGGIFWNGRNSGFGPDHRGWGMSDVKDRLFKDRAKCWTVSGSLYYIRHSVWDVLRNDPPYVELVGHDKAGFLETNHYFEETFCSVHAGQLGYEVWYDGTVDTAGHTWHASAPIGVPSRDHFAESREMYKTYCDKLGIQHEC